MVSSSFYHWTTRFELSNNETSLLDSLQVSRIYAKFFDIDWDAGRQDAQPQAEIQIDSSSLSGRQLIPVIFITNRCMQQVDDIPLLAQRLVGKVNTLAIQPYDELQIDCDWSGSTRAAYFQLLEEVRLLLPKGTTLSVTIRLHQLRYPEQTGVPPADRGALMLYNMGDLNDWQENNSILNIPKTRPYLNKTSKGYPLPLDVALPLYHWGVLYRNGEMIKLINGLEASALRDPQRFEKLTEQRFRVLKSTYLDGYYLYKQDLIRLESVSFAALEAATQLVQQHLRPDDRQLLFYHLDTAVLKHWSHAELEFLRQQLEQ